MKIIASHTSPAEINDDVQVRLINLLGEVMYQQVVGSNEFEASLQIPVNNFPAGIYSVEVTSGEKRWVEKMVVE